MYDANFYDTINDGSTRSAEVIVPRVLDLTAPASVIDVGCGEGAWLAAFARRGCAVTGTDGPHVDLDRLLIDPDQFRPARLDVERVTGSFDLAMSLEVAEHLPPSRADSFIEDLCNLAPVVLFSAAIPGQGGTGHINEQWPGYWAARFEGQGFAVSGALRWEIWNDERVENWYRQNLLLCVKADHNASPALATLMAHPTSEPFPVIHPVLWDHRMQIGF